MGEGEFILDCDASNVALGAVLSQVQEGEARVIAYYSVSLELNVSIILPEKKV